MDQSSGQPVLEDLSFLADGGAMGEQIRAFDWSRTPLDSPQHWPQSLRTIISTCLNSRFPILIWWGRDLITLYNDGYGPMLGDKHPAALGRPGREVWAEIWHIIGPMLDGVMQRGEATWSQDQMLPLHRHGYTEECYFTFTYSPIRAETGEIGGVFCAVMETTGRVIGERRLATLRELGEQSIKGSRSVEGACDAAAAVLTRNRADVPFALLYLLEEQTATPRLVSAPGIAPGFARSSLATADQCYDCGLPLATVARTGESIVIERLDPRIQRHAAGPWPEPPARALLLPIRRGGMQGQLDGVLVSGISARLELNAEYRAFLDLVAGHIASALAAARAYEEERLRAEALAEIDRAKTTFFTNISHEFRTPLTLLQGPLEEALAGRHGALPDSLAEGLEMARRNGLRLLKLVNSLLDFARIEAGRIRARYEPVELAAWTADLAGVFRSAIERAGMRLVVRCPPLPEAVYVDRDMWEKIVLNLLSNAFKYTLEGEIEVALDAAGGQARLSVRDTGVGIPPEELPHMFKRFHRVPGSRGRSQEGTGIGLALVHELVRLHGGTVQVTSAPAAGSTFCVMIPFGTAHLDPRSIQPASLDEIASQPVASTFVEEALRWLPDAAGQLLPALDEVDIALIKAERARSDLSYARVLIADDNADMRSYLHRLLSPRYVVELASDGLAALEAARARTPDLVLTDIMMPRLDGLGLLHALRDDAATAEVPVILLSARAGEEARVEGMQAGADDYLIKPFSARELLARVDGHLKIARTRQDARRALAQQAKELSEANRAKDEFLAMLGHELRNPLSPIVTALELLRMRGVQSRELDIIQRQVGNLGRLVDDLLDVSRITRGAMQLRKEPVELRAAVMRAVEMAAPLLEQRRHPLSLDVPDGLTVMGDMARLAQVISNLLTNAAKYSDLDAPVAVKGWREGDAIHLSVTDTGIGIAPDMLAHIFDPFVQERQSMDRARGGLGLGLAIVHNLVQMHEGSVEAHSPGPGAGSVFTITLPALVQHALPFPCMPERSARQLGSGRRVLVVDDNGDAAALLKSALEENGYTVTVAQDGPSALRTAVSFQPDIALLDIGLPVMDGYELGRRLREQEDAPQRLRLVALTGYGLEADRERSVAAGFDAHLVKPVDLDALLRVVG